jgi:NAD(P)H-flavin reductase
LKLKKLDYVYGYTYPCKVCLKKERRKMNQDDAPIDDLDCVLTVDDGPEGDERIVLSLNEQIEQSEFFANEAI